jgi:hypothetical protein
LVNTVGKNNKKNLYSLVIDVAEDLFLTKTAVRIAAITMARSKAARTAKVVRKGVHR